jgi:hypothetical protein
VVPLKEGEITGVNQRVSPMMGPPRGAPRWVPQRGPSKGVPQAESSKGSPPRGSAKGVPPRGFSQEGSLNGVPVMGVQRGPRRVFLQGSSKAAPQGVTAKGFPSRGVSKAGPRKRDPPREVPQVWSPKGGLPRAVAQRGSLWGEPKGFQQEGSSKDVPIGRSLKGLPNTGFPDGDPSGYTNVSQRGYRSGCPTRGVSKAGSPKRVPQGVPQGG